MEIMKGERRHEKRRCQDDGGLVVVVTFWMGGKCFVKVVFDQGCKTKVSTQLVVAGGLWGGRVGNRLANDRDLKMGRLGLQAGLV